MPYRVGLIGLPLLGVFALVAWPESYLVILYGSAIGIALVFTMGVCRAAADGDATSRTRLSPEQQADSYAFTINAVEGQGNMKLGAALRAEAARQGVALDPPPGDATELRAS